MNAPDPVLSMKAIVQPVFGGPEVLRSEQVARPALRDDGVLVQIVAAGVTKGDWHLVTGTPYAIRIAGYGFSKPKNPIPGMAIAGRVAAVGARVTAFRVGDEVFGEINRGGYAEYVCAAEGELAIKPTTLSFEEAAAIPVSATTALQGLRDAAKLQPGQSVLINGAAGGVGTFAVQIAKQMGAVVTAVCSARNADLVRSLGADHVLDYAQQDFTAAGTKYDVIFDLIGNHSVAACRTVLTEKGRYIAAAGGAENPWVGPLFTTLGGMASNLTSAQAFVPLMAKPSKDDLTTVAAWMEAGTVRAVLDRRYTLEDGPEALRYLGAGHSVGKSVILP